MDAWLSEVLKGDQFGFIMLAAAFLFGMSSAATTAACGGLPAMLVIVGYTGSSKASQKTLFLAAGAFTLSSVLALGSLGALSSFFGQSLLSATGSFGFYAQKVLGLIAIFIGLSALDLTPFRFPTFKVSTDKLPPGMIGAILVGLSVGLATAGCATACSPLQLPIVLGLAALRGEVLMGTIILVVFALGFVFPLVAIMLGIGMGKSFTIMEKIDKPLRIVSGLLLIGLGFWFLASSGY